MKKLKLLTLVFTVCTAYLVVCAYRSGAGSNGYDCTGAETGLGNVAGCTNCHGSSATTGITVAIELDSTGGKPTNYYVGGKTYTVKLTGKNTTSSSLPDFGFQLTSIQGTTAVTTPVNEGTFTAATGTHIAAAQSGSMAISLVEQSSAIKATTGSGGNGTTYVESFTWVAPAKGTGQISFWAVVNAVNGDGNASSSDHWNTGHIPITEIVPSTVGINGITDNNDVNVYPNPVSTHVTFSLGKEVNNATIALYDITGKQVKEVSFNGKEITFDKGNLTGGIYFYNITSDNQSIKTGKLIVQ